MRNKNREYDQKTVLPVARGLMSYFNVVCYSCGELGHHVDKCTKLKSYFVYKVVTHKVGEYLVRKKTHVSTRCVGSAASGLGLYHLDMSE